MTAYEVRDSRVAHEGRRIRVRLDEIVLPDGSTITREIVERENSVAVVALDDRRQIVLVHHYRQPVGGLLWELPAGLCDEEGEPPEQTARRELAEETGVRAEAWSTLVDLHLSPGVSTEAARVYLAEDLTIGPRAGEAHGEEAFLTTRWLPLEEAETWVLDGRITNALAVGGILAAARYVRAGTHPPRPADAPWPQPEKP
ncbi:NUDIX domain-containing protein [Pseudonocardia bannensis]|uniref:NUDIX hydrolase n=1 Tax=Pseudonocardia bannensis TaxID=630973 RepID=A0A848DPS5_9PSEU|nr:NUDIX hydrolase [Pseudonocardia bannensis]NMH94391.1 NUDIX hydrolase [Pseudonocardia bannensis]